MVVDARFTIRRFVERMLILFLCIFLLAPHYLFSTFPAQAAYANGYSYRRALTIDETKVEGSSNLSNFQVLISFTSVSLKTTGNGGNVQNSNGYDIIFTSNDGITQLDHEMVSYGASTGAVLAWVRVPTVYYNANTVIYIYYGNSSILTYQGDNVGTWDSTYFQVFHMEADASSLPDSSGHIDLPRSSSAAATTGVVGGGLNFASGGTYYTTSGPGSDAPSTTGPMGLEGWIWIPSGMGEKTAFGWGDNAAQGHRFSMHVNTGTSLLYLEGLNIATSIPMPSANTWHHVVFTAPSSATASNAMIYVDGVSQSTTVTAAGSFATPANGMTVGDLAGFVVGSFRWPGKLDELRFVNVERSAGWIGTEYNNQNSPASFYTLGSEEIFVDSITTSSDIMSDQGAGATSDHTLTWTSSYQNVAGDTITVDFTSADFSFNVAGSWQTSDFTFTDTTHSAAAPLAVGAAPSCTATNNYTVSVDSTTETFTITFCSGWVANTVSTSTTFKVFGTADTGTGTITNNTDVDSSPTSIVYATAGMPSVELVVVIDTNADVILSAMVDAELTFNISDNSIGFGTLNVGADRYANGSETGSATAVAAHTFSVSTNGTGGFVVSINGSTLTSGGYSIDAIGDTAASPNGGTGEQFGVHYTVAGGNGTVTAPYNDNSPKYAFGTSMPSEIASSTGSSASSTYSAFYIANVSNVTEAGTYSTVINYVATGTF